MHAAHPAGGAMRAWPDAPGARCCRLFFHPLSVMEIRIKLNDRNLPSGEAFVDFASDADAQEAMRRDRQIMSACCARPVRPAAPMCTPPAT